MRSILAAAIIPLVANALDCGGSATPPAPQANVQVSAPAVAAAAPIAPSHGGKIVAVGSANLEIIVKSDGAVEAYPVGGSASATGTATATGSGTAAAPTPAAPTPQTGQAAAPAAAGSASATASIVPPTATVDARVATTAGVSAPIRLVWNARGFFEGRLTTAVPRPGDVELSVASNGGAAVTGRATAAPIVIVPARGGTLVDVGNAKAEIVVASNGVVQVIPAYATAEATASIPSSATMEADVAIEGGTNEHLVLAWRPASFVYEGRVAAGHRVSRGATVIHVINGQQRVEARAPSIEIQPTTALVVEGPQFGGSVVEVEGGAKVEVAVANDGRVVARPIATSVTSPMIESGANVSIEVTGQGGARQTVPLRWDATGASFQGRAEGNARFQNGPAEVVVVRPNMPPMRGRAEVVTVVPAATFDARLTLFAAPPRAEITGQARADLRGEGAGVQAEAARARAQAEAEAAAAQARVRVTVQPPVVQPPTVRVGVSGSASGGTGGSTSTSTTRTTTTTGTSGSGSASGSVRIGGGVRFGH